MVISTESKEANLLNFWGASIGTFSEIICMAGYFIHKKSKEDNNLPAKKQWERDGLGTISLFYFLKMLTLVVLVQLVVSNSINAKLNVSGYKKP